MTYDEEHAWRTKGEEAIKAEQIRRLRAYLDRKALELIEARKRQDREHTRRAREVVAENIRRRKLSRMLGAAASRYL